MTYHCTLLQRPNLAFVSGTIAFRVPFRGAHVHDCVLKRLLVVRPRGPLGLQRFLEVSELVRPLLEVLLNGAEFIFEGLVFELRERWVLREVQDDK